MPRKVSQEVINRAGGYPHLQDGYHNMLHYLGTLGPNRLRSVVQLASSNKPGLLKGNQPNSWVYAGVTFLVSPVRV